MAQRWVSKGKGEDRKKYAIETDRKPQVREVRLNDMGKSAGQLQKQAWDILGGLSNITSMDKLLLSLRKYSGLLGSFSGANAMLIIGQDPNATVVRSATEWKYFGREVKPGAEKLSVIFPVGIPSKAGAGKIKDFIEKRREEGLSDETISQMVKEKFNTQQHEAFMFGVGSVYDIKDTEPIPGKAQKPESETIKARQFYKDLKEVAKKHYVVEENSEPSMDNALGYSSHSTEEGTKIVVMKVPGEDLNQLHTLIHEMSHARLHGEDSKLTRGMREAEAELSTYLVGEHFGFDFRDDSATYIKAWLDNPSTGAKTMSKEAIDRAMNNARWVINQVTNQIAIGQ